MNKNLRLSIITITYNAADALEETMQSVLSQDYENFEYIIIDGGSTDGTQQVVEKYMAKLSHFVSEPDNGIYDAMNKGIRLAKGDIVGMINAGDHYYPETFSRVVGAMQTCDLSRTILWGDVQYEHSGRVKGFRPENVKRGAFAPHPSMFCPRAVYERIGLYDTGFRLMGDYDFMYRAVNVAEVEALYLPELLAFYKEGGLSDRNVGECLREELAAKIKNGQNRVTARCMYYLKLLKNFRRL